jgi:tartrate-resistant acid phosphatase type 5
MINSKNKRSTCLLFFPLALALLVTGCVTTDGKQSKREINYTDYSQRQKLTILVFGDYGFGTDDQYKIGKTMKRVCDRVKCDFAITTGDNIYEEGVSSVNDPDLQNYFEKPYAHFGRFDFFMSLGNHDHRGDADAEVAYTNYSERWRMPARYYAIPKLPSWARIYALDTTRVTPQQIAAAKENLCSAKGWKIVFGHHPPYTSTTSTEKPKPTTIYVDQTHRELMPLIKECRIDAMLAGHYHLQEHITSPNIDILVQGAAANTTRRYLMDLKAGAKSLFREKTLGFGIVTITPSTFSTKFYNEDGKTIYTWSKSK